jgi:hypothetical protein
MGFRDERRLKIVSEALLLEGAMEDCTPEDKGYLNDVES